MQWYNISEFSQLPDLNILMILGALLFSCALYAIAIWCFNAEWSWPPGVPTPFYFFLMKSYWCGSKRIEEEYINNEENENNSELFEDKPSVSPCVVIRNLFKKFRTGSGTKLAVKDLSLKIYSGQITVLLGHSGAGKTTTVNVLTGLYYPSSGTASINGFDILTETTRARRGLGVCPQHSHLYDTLTVEENLKIYAVMKGVPWRSLNSETNEILNMLKLADERTQLAKDLSGGMKRKLSLGIALIGGSKVLFLDEPTSGLDTEDRRIVWDALLSIKQSRTTILTTHSMEEADMLGDRIAIMAEGELLCCGSPTFLKQKFGSVYHLHVVKDNSFDLNALISLINKYVPEVTIRNEHEREISFNLPPNKISGFGDMFEKMENRKVELGVISFGVTTKTMEDVFLNASNIYDIKCKLHSETTIENVFHFKDEDVFGYSPGRKPQPNAVHQFFALLLKRFHYFKRHWSILVAQLAIPFVLMCLCLYIIKSYRQQYRYEFGSLKLNIYSLYGATDGFYHEENPQLFRLAETMKNVYESNRINMQKVPNPTYYILDYAKKDVYKYFKSFLVGGSVDQYSNGTLKLTAWFNGQPFHVLPMSLLLMHTVLLRNITSTGSISLINSPFPELPSYINQDSDRVIKFLTTVFVPLAFGFLSASFALVPVHERATKAKLLQIMSGVPVALYWTAMFLWDFLVHFIVCFLMIIPYAVFANYAFFGMHFEAIGSSLLLMLLYGWSSIPFSYLISFMFEKESTAFSAVVRICAIIGVGCASILKTLQAAGKSVDTVVWIFRLFPTFSFASGMSNLHAAAFSNVFCERAPSYDLEFQCNSPDMDESNPLFKCYKDVCGDNCHKIIDPMQWDKNSSGQDMLTLFIDGIIYFGIVLFIERRGMVTLLQNGKSHSPKISKSSEDNIADSNVFEEEDRIRNLLSSNRGSNGEALVVSDLTKVVDDMDFYAVNHLTFGIHQGECFGLLGPNGAGKTTAFRMLAGDCYPSEGNAFIQNCSLNSNLKKFQSHIGYCPQFDGLIDRLTGREMLVLFGRLRGLTGADLHEKVEKMIKMTGLTEHADKETRFYNGNTKRKLSVTMAVIGSPPLILLDEPTAGMDPVSCRKIWNILSQVRKNTGTAVLLTVQSIEECEALCNRLAIMVNGRFRCLGSVQELKAKYGQGYTLKFKLKRKDQNNNKKLNDVKAHIQNNLIRVNLKDDHEGTLQYHVVHPSITLSYLFKFMEKMKIEFQLEDYFINNSSLEQIFLAFARAQRDTI